MQTHQVQADMVQVKALLSQTSQIIENLMHLNILITSFFFIKKKKIEKYSQYMEWSFMQHLLNVVVKADLQRNA